MRSIEPSVSFESFLPRQLSAKDLAGLTDVLNATAAEIRPDDPAKPVAYVDDLYTSLADAHEYDRRFWLARHGAAVVGVVTASRRTRGGNGKVLHVELLVKPRARRRGIGRNLLRRAATFGRQTDQETVIGLVTGKEPATELPGGRFLWDLGARPALAHRIYRLELCDVDHDLLRRWERAGAERSPGIELIWRDEPFLDRELEAVSRIMQAMNTAPRGDLKTEPTHYTPESVAERDRNLFTRGIERSVLLARERSGGAFLGYTMMLVDPYDERLLRQADTAVDPAARGRGLGKWLKASMLLRTMRNHPRRTEVRTGTADDNRAMLDINRRIGFRPWLEHGVWQISLDQLEAALVGTDCAVRMGRHG